MPKNNEGDDFFAGFDIENNVSGSTGNRTDDFFSGFDDTHENNNTTKPKEQTTTHVLPSNSADSKAHNSEPEKKSLSSLFIVLTCIVLLCVGGFSHKVMIDSNTPHPASIPAQENKQSKNESSVSLSTVSYKQFKNDRTGVAFEYPSTCSFDTVGSEECRFKLAGVAEVSVGLNAESVMWDTDIEYNMRRIKGDRIRAGETVSNMQKISDDSCLWQGTTKLGCLYITKTYFVTSASDGKISRYDMIVYFPQVGYSLESDHKTKEIVQYMLGSYRVDPPTKHAKEDNDSSKTSSSSSANANTQPQAPNEQTNQISKKSLPYKTFRNDVVGYSFDYPANVAIDETNEIGVRFSLNRVVKISVGINNTNAWSTDMQHNIKAIKDDARIYRDSIEQLQQLSENSLLIHGKDKFGMNYIEKAYFISNPTNGKLARYDMTVYCDSQGYTFESEPQVKEIVQYMLDSYKFR